MKGWGYSPYPLQQKVVIMGKEVKEMETKNLLDEQSEIFNVIVSNADANRKTTIPILLSRMCEIERELTLRENR